MSMGPLLTAVRDHLRTVLGIDKGLGRCDIQPGGHPPPMAADHFIGLDDGGTTFWSGDELWLGERYNVIISLMVKLGAMPEDMYGDFLQRNSSLYLSLDSMERKVKAALHGNNNLRLALISSGGFGSEQYGDIPTFPLMCKSQNRSWVYTDKYGNSDPRGWLRRDLNFSGMDRQFLIGSVA